MADTEGSKTYKLKIEEEIDLIKINGKQQLWDRDQLYLADIPYQLCLGRSC
jgi:hypothetical protein